VTLIFHCRHLLPLVLFYDVLFYRAQPLFTTEAAQNINIVTAHSDCMGISALIHHRLGDDFVFDGQVNAGVFFWGRASASDKNFGG
jgi:hypothetical protein